MSMGPCAMDGGAAEGCFMRGMLPGALEDLRPCQWERLAAQMFALVLTRSLEASCL